MHSPETTAPVDLSSSSERPPVALVPADPFGRWPVTAALVALLIGVLTLAGWWLRFPRLTALMPGTPSMAANTAFMTVLCSAALLLGGTRPPYSSAVVRVAGTVLVALAAATLLQYILGIDLQIDRLLTRAQPPSGLAYPGRPAPQTAVAFLGVGVALLAVPSQAPAAARRVVGGALVAGAMALIGLLGLVFRVGALYGIPSQITNSDMAVQTAAALLALSFAIAATRPQAAPLSVLSSEESGGVMARRLLLGLLALPGLALLLRAAVGMGMLEPAMAVALGVFSTLSGFGWALVATARRANEESVMRRRQSERLKRSEAELATFIDSAVDGIFTADLDGRYVGVNEAGCRLLGYTREEILSLRITDLIRPEELARLAQQKARMLAGDVDVSEWSLLRKDGSRVEVEVSAKILPDGRWQGFVRDITQRKLTEQRLEEAAIVFNSTSEAIMILDARCRVVRVNRAFEQITGFAAGLAVGRHPRLLRSRRTRPSVFRQMRVGIARNGQWCGEVWNRRSDGHIYPVWQTISAVKDELGKASCFVCVFADISELKQAQDRLYQLAHHDTLTGLPNRLLFSVVANKALERARRHGRTLALLYVDLDRFKLVNDTLGHAAGDRLLTVVGARLKECVRAEDTVARLGGDEFTVLLDEVESQEGPAHIAQKIIHAVSQPLQLGGRQMAVSCSVGIGLYPDDAGSLEDLQRAADAALYQAKDSGRARFGFYSRALSEHAAERLTIEIALREALARGELLLHYQPQFDLQGGGVTGAEALLRWRHPSEGLMLPHRFIGIAEDTGLIEPIGEWVVREACSQAVAWRRKGLRLPRMSVNLAARQILHDHVASTIEVSMREEDLHGPPPIRFEVEITESALQSPHSIEVLHRLRAIGVVTAVDDFGTGYSSMATLKSLPLDALKLDRVFVEGLPDDSSDKALVHAIVGVARALGLRVVAEGIESAAQLDYLRAAGCDEGQGFLLAPPMAPHAFENWWAERPPA